MAAKKDNRAFCDGCGKLYSYELCGCPQLKELTRPKWLNGVLGLSKDELAALVVSLWECLDEEYLNHKMRIFAMENERALLHRSYHELTSRIELLRRSRTPHAAADARIAVADRDAVQARISALTARLLAELESRTGRKAKPEPETKPERRTRDQSNLCCSFCGRGQRQVDKLIAGPTVYICSDCVGFAVRSRHARVLCSFCGKNDQDGVTKDTVAICVECIGLCQEIIAEEGARQLPPKAPPALPASAQLALPAREEMGLTE